MVFANLSASMVSDRSKGTQGKTYNTDDLVNRKAGKLLLTHLSERVQTFYISKRAFHV
jgi:hypothetical protein